MSQQKLIPEMGETHGHDAQQFANKYRGASGTKVRAWCGKRVDPAQIITSGAKPSCYQCGLIWERDHKPEAYSRAEFERDQLGQTGAELADAEIAAPAASPQMTVNSVHECAKILLAANCPNCNGRKMAKIVFCRHCYGRLPGELKAALYRRWGNGFKEAYESSMRVLRPPAA